MSNDVKLNDQEKQLVELLLAGTAHTRIASILRTTPYNVSKLLESPKLQTAIQIRVAARLNAGAALAIGVVEEVLLDKKATPKTRLDAAGKFLDYAFRLNGKSGKAASVSDLSNEQLHALAEQLTNEKGNRAKTIDVDATKPASDCDTDIFSA